MEIGIDHNSSFLNDLVKSFPGAAQKAIGTATGRSRKGVVTDLSRAIPQEYSIGAGKIRKSVSSRNTGRNSSETIVAGAPISLIHFTRARVTKRRPAGGVSVNVKKTRKVVKGSFAARMHNGQIHLFKRVGNERLPLKKLVSVSIPLMVSDSVVLEVQSGVNSRFLKSFKHEANRFLNRK